MTAEERPDPAAGRRGWTSRVTLAAIAHAEDPDVLRPTAEPTSPVALQLTRVDDVAADGTISLGAPELVVTAVEAPLGVGDVDDLIARLTAARDRMLAAAPDLSARPGHRADAERP